MLNDDSELPRVLRDMLKHLETEVASVKMAIEGKPEIGFKGMAAKLAFIEKEFRDLKDVQEAFLRDDKSRRERQARNQKYLIAAISVVGAGFVAVILQFMGVS